VRRGRFVAFVTGVSGPLMVTKPDLRVRAAKCSYAHIAAIKGKCVALRHKIRALLTESDGNTSLSGRRSSGIRFCKHRSALRRAGAYRAKT
jgi:hypothetical protein